MLAPSCLILPREGPRYSGADISHPSHALSEFLTHLIHENNKIVILHHHDYYFKFWDGLLHSS